MARIGYLRNTPHYKFLEEDKQWMLNNGCEQIIEEQNIHEKLRPEWQRLIEALTTSDELVVGKFSNAVRGARELSILLEFCRKNMVRVISIRDRIDSIGEMFQDTRSSDILNMMATLPQEALAMRRANSSTSKLKKPIKAHTSATLLKLERNKMVVNMYKSGHTIDDIWQRSGFKSRSSLFRILNEAGVDLNRGHTKGPLKKRNHSNEEDDNEKD